MDSLKGHFVQQLRNHSALAVTLEDSCKSIPRVINKMLVELARADWMDAEVRCNASMVFVRQGGNQCPLDVNQWAELLESYAGARRRPELLQSAMQSLKPLGGISRIEEDVWDMLGPPEVLLSR